jgi:hypothetical protein
MKQIDKLLAEGCEGWVMSAEGYRVRVVVCPGIHDRELTQQFIEGLLTTCEERFIQHRGWCFQPIVTPLIQGCTFCTFFMKN